MFLLNRKPALLVLLAACAVTVGATRRQGSPPVEERRKAVEAKVLFISDAPVKFMIAPNGSGYFVCNHHETASMSGFRFGCAEEVKGGLKIWERRPHKQLLRAVEPKAGDKVICYMAGVNHGLFPEPFCKAGKLAVVEVGFDDGTLWELKPAGR